MDAICHDRNTHNNNNKLNIELRDSDEIQQIVAVAVAAS